MDARISAPAPDTTAIMPMGLAAPPERRRVWLSPINRRRWHNFKANRRGYIAFWVFMVLFVVTLFAEFLANDKPFMVRLEGKTYFPVVFATLFIFSLVGLAVNLIADLTYTWVDPRIDFETREV